jgi:hypothetical protein
MRAFDASVWSGRAVQEVFVELVDAVLHYCIRPLTPARTGGDDLRLTFACELNDESTSHRSMALSV